MEILWAYYGDFSESCPYNIHTCGNDLTDLIKNHKCSTNSCTVMASNTDLLGDPCVHVRLYN